MEILSSPLAVGPRAIHRKMARRAAVEEKRRLGRRWTALGLAFIAAAATVATLSPDDFPTRGLAILLCAGAGIAVVLCRWMRGEPA